MALSLFLPHGAIIVSLVSLCFYLVSIIVYRLFLSPIANIPGPKLAAVTSWVEINWDLVKGGKVRLQDRRMA